MATITGGTKLEAKLREIAANLKSGGTLRVGFLEGATYPDGTSVAMVAALDEYGHGKTPPRPYFRTMIAEKSPEWPDAIADLLKTNNYDVKRTLETAGEAIKGQLQQSIIDLNEPALSAITVMLRGMKANNPSLVVTGSTVGEAARRVKAGLTNYGASTKPLVESGHMLNSVSYEVETS